MEKDIELLTCEEIGEGLLTGKLPEAIIARHQCGIRSAGEVWQRLKTQQKRLK